MKFQYKIVYDTPYSYKTGSFCFDPNLPVPVPKEDPDYGRTLKDVMGMTDEEATAIVIEAKWTQVKAIRDGLLKDSDWTQGADVPESIKAPWSEYRTVLRNIPQDFINPDDVEFPEKP